MKDDFMSFASGQISESIGTNTFVKIKKRKDIDKYKETFLRCLDLLEVCFKKSLATQEIGISLMEYEQSYWDVIDTLIYLLFKDDSYVDIINYYVYERIDGEGVNFPYFDKDLKTEFVLNTPEDVWNLIIQKQTLKNASTKANK